MAAVNRRAVKLSRDAEWRYQRLGYLRTVLIHDVMQQHSVGRSWWRPAQDNKIESLWTALGGSIVPGTDNKHNAYLHHIDDKIITTILLLLLLLLLMMVMMMMLMMITMTRMMAIMMMITMVIMITTVVVMMIVLMTIVMMTK